MKKVIAEKLGEMIIGFQMLESSVNHAIHGLLTLPLSHSEMILAEMSFRNKLNLLSCLSDEILHQHKDLLDALKEVIKEINKIEGERNRLVHSTWFTEFEAARGQVIRSKTTAKQNGLKKQIELVGGEQLEELITTHEHIQKQFDDITTQVSIRLDRRHMSPLMAFYNETSYNDLLAVINNSYPPIPDQN